jgi:hypothetical protein
VSRTSVNISMSRTASRLVKQTSDSTWPKGRLHWKSKSLWRPLNLRKAA